MQSLSQSSSNSALLDAALRQARVNLGTKPLGKGIANSIDILPGDDLSKRGRNNLVAQRKKPVDDQRRAGVLGRETCDNSGRLTVHVQLRVEGSGRKDCQHARAELGANGSLLPVGVQHTGLGEHLSRDTSGGDGKNLGGAGMEVQNAHGAGYIEVSVSMVLIQEESPESLGVLRSSDPSAKAAPVPTRAGKVFALAKGTGFLAKSKTKSSSLGRRL